MKKWIIKLARPAVVNDVLRNPVEGALTVNEAEAERLFLSGVLVGDPEPEPDPDEDEEDGDGLDKMKVPDLHILVTKEGVALNDATKKDEIIAAIRKHREAKAAG